MRRRDGLHPAPRDGKPIPLIAARARARSSRRSSSRSSHRALAKKPEDRFASAADFALALKAVLEGKTVLPRELSRAEDTRANTLPMPGAPARPASAEAPAGSASSQPPAGSRQSSVAPSGALAGRATAPTELTARRPQSLGMLVAVALLCLVVGAGAMIGLLKLTGH